MNGEYDAKLPWPFKMKVKFTVIDQQIDPVKQQNIAHLSILDNNPIASWTPVKEENEWFVILGICHETLRSRCYLVDDTLFLQV